MLGLPRPLISHLESGYSPGQSGRSSAGHWHWELGKSLLWGQGASCALKDVHQHAWLYPPLLTPSWDKKNVSRQYKLSPGEGATRLAHRNAQIRNIHKSWGDAIQRPSILYAHTQQNPTLPMTPLISSLFTPTSQPEKLRQSVPNLASHSSFLKPGPAPWECNLQSHTALGLGDPTLLLESRNSY